MSFDDMQDYFQINRPLFQKDFKTCFPQRLLVGLCAACMLLAAVLLYWLAASWSVFYLHGGGSFLSFQTTSSPSTTTETSFRGDFPVPPPYSVATSLPTYDEAEKAKAAAMAASAVEVIPRVRQCTHKLALLLYNNIGMFFFLLGAQMVVISHRGSARVWSW